MNTAQGQLDIEASSRKLAEAYRNLERRMGAGDAPPKSAEEYAPKVELEGFDWEEFKANPEMQSFLKGAHAKGITNDQLSYVLNEHIRQLSAATIANTAISQEQAAAELQKVWGNKAEFDQNLKAAYRAFEQFADPEDMARIDEIGNNPLIIRILARAGQNLNEDRPMDGKAGDNMGFNARIAQILEQLDEMPVHDPRRQALLAEKERLYEQRMGSKRQKLEFEATKTL